MSETLYVVATPIGNLEDVTLRALRVLREAAVIAAEDTRTTRKLLSFYDIHTKVISYNEHNSSIRTPQLLRVLESEDVALVSEAGTPTVSDPGREIVRAAVERGFRVCPVPGPSSVIAALAVAGLPDEGFTFIGFLPRQKKDRRHLLASMALSPWALVAFETPHRLSAALEDAQAILGDRAVVVCRELTKAHEEVFRGTLSEAQRYFTEPRGEFTLVMAGAPPEEPTAVSDDVLRAGVADLRRQGLTPSAASAQVARRYGVPRRYVYRLAVAPRL